MLFQELPWYLGGAVILIALLFSLTGTTGPVPQNVPRLAIPQKPNQKPKEKLSYMDKPAVGSVTDPLAFKPTIPPDGIAGIGSIGNGGPLSVGKRTGAASFYIGGAQNNNMIRLKDDLRLNMPFANIKDEASGVNPFKNLVMAHFRTSEPIIRTKSLDPTLETMKTGFDEWAQEP